MYLCARAWHHACECVRVYIAVPINERIRYYIKVKLRASFQQGNGDTRQKHISVSQHAACLRASAGLWRAARSGRRAE